MNTLFAKEMNLSFGFFLIFAILCMFCIHNTWAVDSSTVSEAPVEPTPASVPAPAPVLATGTKKKFYIRVNNFQMKRRIVRRKNNKKKSG